MSPKFGRADGQRFREAEGLKRAYLHIWEFPCPYHGTIVISREARRSDLGARCPLCNTRQWENVESWGERLCSSVHEERLEELRKVRIGFYRDLVRLLHLQNVQEELDSDPEIAVRKLYYGGGVGVLIRVADGTESWDNPTIRRPKAHEGETFREHMAHRRPLK